MALNLSPRLQIKFVIFDYLSLVKPKDFFWFLKLKNPVDKLTKQGTGYGFKQRQESTTC
jgi:phage anti-repressor protein